MSHFRLFACIVNNNVDAFLLFFLTFEYKRKQFNLIVSCDWYSYNTARIIYLFIFFSFTKRKKQNHIGYIHGE